MKKIQSFNRSIVQSFNRSIVQSFNRGFSLIEVMVAGAIMVGLGLTLTQLTNNTNKSIKHSEMKSEYELAFHQVFTAMNEEVSCFETLRNIDVDTAKSNVSSIIRCKVSENFTAKIKSSCSNDPDDKKFVSGCNCETNPSSPLYDSTCRIEVRRKCKVGQMSSVFKSDSGATKYSNGTYTVVMEFEVTSKDEASRSGFGSLNIKFNKTAKQVISSYGGNSYVRKVENILFEFDPITRRITKCYNGEQNAINTAVARSCTGNNAFLIGSPNDSNNPLRCVHNVDKTSTGSCPRDTFLNGYTTGIDPESGHPNALKPICEKLSTKTVGCAPGEYIVEKIVSGQPALSCFSLPVCLVGQHLVKGPDGLLACDNVKTSCAEGELMVAGPLGKVECKTCSQGEVLVKNSTQWECKQLQCKNLANQDQEYMVGIDSNGNAMCRKLLTSDKPCQFGAQLTVKEDGSVGTTCCPSCSIGETMNYCTGTNFVSTNSCGSICQGSKPVRNGYPGVWYTAQECSPWSHEKIERRNCINSDCGGDPYCNGMEMERRTECFLYGNQHTFKQCTSIGGTVGYGGSNFLCYMPVNQPGGRVGGHSSYGGTDKIASHGMPGCPKAGWNTLDNYSSASGQGCGCNRSSKDGCDLPGPCETAFVSGWWRSSTYNSSTGKDTRRTRFGAFCNGDVYEFKCHANIYERGCY